MLVYRDQNQMTFVNVPVSTYQSDISARSMKSSTLVCTERNSFQLFERVKVINKVDVPVISDIVENIEQ